MVAEKFVFQFQGVVWASDKAGVSAHRIVIPVTLILVNNHLLRSREVHLSSLVYSVKRVSVLYLLPTCPPL